MISSTCFGQILPIFRSARLRFFTTYGIVSCCCGGQGFGEGQSGTTCTVWRKLLPLYRTRSVTLPRSEPLPTTTTGHYTICCKKYHYCAPEDGQKFARNMSSWSWRSIKLLLLYLVGVYITLPKYIWNLQHAWLLLIWLWWKCFPVKAMLLWFYVNNRILKLH